MSSGAISWILILFVDLFLAFGPAAIILFSRKATGKIKRKFFFCIASVTVFPSLLVSFMAAVTVIALGKNRTDLLFIEALATPVLMFFSGWFVLYLFYKKTKIAHVDSLPK
jgi:hypothetical protein